MASMDAANAEMQVFIDRHYDMCKAALKRVSLLADEHSDEHKKTFGSYYRMGDRPSGWRIAEEMRKTAEQAIGIFRLDI